MTNETSGPSPLVPIQRPDSYRRAVNLSPMPWYQDPHVLVPLWIVLAAICLAQSAVSYYRKPLSISARKTAPLLLLMACTSLALVAGQLLLEVHAPLWLMFVILAMVVPTFAILLKLLSTQTE